jgi:orotate phosphoribosyltransferase
VLDAVATTRGHYAYESGHHGDLWLDLDALFLDAARARPWAIALARQAAPCRPELICGPLTGGAFLAQAIADEMACGFLYAERLTSESGAVAYRIPSSLREVPRGRRVLLVDDAVNAGSAWRASLADLLTCDAEVVGFAALLTLGDAAAAIAERHGAPLYALASLERHLWTPGDCPLCASRTPLDEPAVRS